MSIKLKPYPKYKNSGIEWLGEVPVGWEVKKFRFLGKTIIGLTYAPNDITDKLQGTLVLRSSNIQNGKINFDDNVYVSCSIPEKLITMKGDILICSRNGSKKLIGKNAMINNQSKNLSFGAFTIVFRSMNVNNRYIYWVFNSSLFNYQSGSFLTTTINQLTTGNINNFESPYPSIEEQKTIANYLDKQTVKIDKLIESYKKLIALSKEKRTALITHCVTKGLDPNVKMKDSGVEWLGEVPEGWSFCRIKYHYENLDYKRIPIKSEDRGNMTGTYPYYGASGIIDYVNDYLFESTNILVGEDGANLLMKSTPIAFIATGKYWVNNHAHILSFNDDNYKFWEYLINVNYG